MRKGERASRKVKRKLSKASSEFRLLNVEVQQAIARTKNSKALGPDQLASLMLKKLGPLAVAYITKMFNCSFANATIPSIRNKSRVIPLLKAGKSPKEAKSYRPVSLLSPMIKLMKMALLPTVMDGAVYVEHQHGFRKGRSTTSALCEIDGHIRAGFNKKTPVDRTIMVALDLRAASDTVSIDKLLCKVNELEIDPVVKRWLTRQKSYLHGRQAIVEFGNATGCLKMTMQDDLHRESKVMPVEHHCQLLSKQYLLMFQSSHHPNHGLMFQQGEKEMRRTLAMEHSEEVIDATELEHPKWMKRGNLILHTRTVRQMITR